VHELRHRISKAASICFLDKETNIVETFHQDFDTLGLHTNREKNYSKCLQQFSPSSTASKQLTAPTTSTSPRSQSPTCNNTKMPPNKQRNTPISPRTSFIRHALRKLAVLSLFVPKLSAHVTFKHQLTNLGPLDVPQLSLSSLWLTITRTQGCDSGGKCCCASGG
jgi:hypothetical protein